MAELTLIHLGDLHGHLVPRPNLRADGTGRLEGGLARMATRIREIREAHPANLLINTGDTIQGGAEALFTRGQAMVDVIDRFGVDLFAPGNWDYLYGKQRFLELFGEGSGADGVGCRWGALAANVYHEDSATTLLPPRTVIHVGGLRVGVIGLSSERGIAVGRGLTDGITFTADARELPDHVAALSADQVDLIVLISEFGLAKNVLIADQNPGIGVVLSSDMHEETRHCVVTSTGALVSEVGQDGTRLGQFDLTIEDGRITAWNYVLHVVDSSIEPDADIDRLVAQARLPFLAGSGFTPHRNPINGELLDQPIDTAIGTTDVPLHRSNFCDHDRPAAVSGTSHDALASAIRDVSGADVGHLRGFRFGTHVPPGPILLGDLYHYLPVGAEIGRIEIRGEQLRKSIEQSADGTFNPDPFAWAGGWLSSYAGVRFALDVHSGKGERISDVQVKRHDESEWSDLDPEATYSFAGFWFPTDPGKVGGLEGSTVATPIRTADRSRGDAATVIAEYLNNHVVVEETSRVRLVSPLPAASFANPELQPLRGAR